MQAATELTRDLVLVGGGHSHALAMRMLAMNPIAGLRITLVSPSSHTPYSGMLPGLIAGHYQFEQAHIDLARLCEWAGARFVAARVTGIDPARKCVRFNDRPAIEYDLVSIDIGSSPELDSVPGARDHAVPVKPIAQLWQRWRALEKSLREAPGDRLHRISVVGGGAGGVEMALAIAHRLGDAPVELALLCADREILKSYNGKSRHAAMAALQRCGVRVHLGARVTSVDASCVVVTGDSRMEYDELFWCTGAAAAPWIADSGLETDDRGFLAVHQTLQSTTDESVFAAGDIASLIRSPLPKAGVYAVRQAPVLAHNLRAALLGKKLRNYRPQRRFLSLISLGEKTAIADRGYFSAAGAWVWRWKDRIDREFMERFEKLPAAMSAVVGDKLPETAQAPLMFCGGCGAKVGADALTAALAQLARDYPGHCVREGGDTTAIPAPSGATVVQSLDLLRQLVADPWLMGRIAANHALSDLYASGARPVSALAAVTLPHASGSLLRRELLQLLDGALREFSVVDCQLRGGHSMQGQELALGFVVNGVAMSGDGRLLSKTGALPGDQLILTKPLGTGTLFAAHMQLALDGRQVSAAIDSMLRSNSVAAGLALSHGASACTDVTGFGLLGHLLEMLGDSLDARIALNTLPLLDGALEHLSAGRVSTMQAANMRSTVESLRYPGNTSDGLLQALFDPQTSGGLLIALPPAAAPGLLEALRQENHVQAQIIGEMVPRENADSPRVDLG